MTTTVKKIIDFVYGGRFSPGALIFPAKGRAWQSQVPISGWSKLVKKMREEVGLAESFTLHDFRRYFSSTMAELGCPMHITERILAHQTGSISEVGRIYMRYDFMREMSEWMQKYDDHLNRMVPDPI